MNLYFPAQKVEENDERIALSKSFETFFLNNRETFLPSPDLSKEFSVPIDFEILRSKGPCRGIFNLLVEKPSDTLAAIGFALYECYRKTLGDVWYEEFPRVNARIQNFPNQVPLRELKSNSLGKFVSLHGTVVRASTIKPIITRMDFLCSRCGSSSTQCFSDGHVSSPTKCTQHGCRGKIFIPDCKTAVSRDWQRIRIQEMLSEETKDSGRIPRTVECELYGDLVDVCVPGDDVTVCGTVKVIQCGLEGSVYASRKKKALYLLYIDACSVRNLKSSTGEKLDSLQFTKKDYAAIRQIAQEPELFRLLVHSLCPSIFGNEIVKSALLLSLFGSSRRFTGNRHLVPLRGDIHVLLIGDPGLGKSQLLQAVSRVTPRGVYVSGNTTSTSGLTVTVVKDSNTGDFSLEAGALVLGDQGTCCIDEFDKMTADHQAMLEAMEQQSISIAKAGIVSSLPARTSVIAAANPVGGHYNRAKTVAENIKLPTPLLSRFDTIFLMLDRPDEERDKILSEHVMSMHSSKKEKDITILFSHSATSTIRAESEHACFKDHLKLRKGEEIDVIPPMLLRKYIGYARKFVFPRLNDEAAAKLQDFYLSLRHRQNPDAAPITTRQLEALIRLAEARARAELRTTVTIEDAIDVIEIVRESYIDTVVDEFGNLDFQRPSGGSGKGKELKRFVKTMTKESEKKESSLFSTQEIRALADDTRVRGFDSFDQLINFLNQQNYLLKRGPRLYKLVTSDSTD